MQSIKKRATRLTATTIRKSIELNKIEIKKSPKVSEGGYMWVG